MDIETKITKLQDGDGHWYWVPNEIVEVFNIDVRHIVGSTYTEYPEMFDAFIDKYDKYRTGGAPSLMPDFFKRE